MPNELDQLSIGLSATAENAVTEIDKVIVALDNLKLKTKISFPPGLTRGFNRLGDSAKNLDKLAPVAQGIREIHDAIQGDWDTKGVSRAASALKRLGDGASKAGGLTAAAVGVLDIKESFQGNWDTKGASRAATTLKKLTGQLGDLPGAVANLDGVKTILDGIKFNGEGVASMADSLKKMLSAFNSISKLDNDKFAQMSDGMRMLSSVALELTDLDVSKIEKYADAMEKLSHVRPVDLQKMKEYGLKNEAAQYHSIGERDAALAERLGFKDFTDSADEASGVLSKLEGQIRNVLYLPNASGGAPKAFTWLEGQGMDAVRTYDKLEDLYDKIAQERADGSVTGLRKMSTQEDVDSYEKAYSLVEGIQHRLKAAAQEGEDLNKATVRVRTRMQEATEATEALKDAIAESSKSDSFSGIEDSVKSVTNAFKNGDLFKGLKSQAAALAPVLKQALAETVVVVDKIGYDLIEDGSRVVEVGENLKALGGIRKPKIIKEMTGELGLLVTAAGHAVKAVGKIAIGFTDMATRAKTAKSDIKELVNAIRSADSKGISSALGTIAKGLGSAFVGIGAIALSAIGSIIKSVANLASLITRIVSGILGAVKSVLSAILSAVQVVIKAITSAIHVIISVVTGIIKAIAGVISFVVKTVSTIVNLIGSVIGIITNIIGMIVHILTAIVSAISAAVRMITSLISGILNVVFSVANAILRTVLKVAGTIISKVVSALKSLTSALVKVGSAAGKAFLSFAFSPFVSFADDVKSAVKALQGLGKRLIRTASMRIFRTAIQNVGKALSEGIENLYEFSRATKLAYSAQFSKSLDSYATSMLYLKNSIGAAAAPLINTFIPAITAATNAVVTLLNAINQLFAALTGSSVYTRAANYATKYGEAASNASKAQKDLLADWDELNIIQSKDSGSGGSGKDLDYSKLFEEAEISNPIKTFAETLRAYFDSGDWKGLGALVAQKVNELVDRIQWTDLGGKIGSGLDAAIKVALGFLDELNTEAIGAALANLFNGAIAKINPSDFGRLLSRRVTAGLDFCIGLLANVKWNAFGQWIHDVIVEALHGLNNWFTQKDWDDVAESIKTGVRDFLSGAKGSEIGAEFWTLLGNAIKASVSVASGAIGGIWSYIWEGSEDGFEGFKKILQPYITEAGGSTVGGIIAYITEKAPEWIKNIYDTVIAPIDAVFEDAFGVRPFEAFGKGVTTILQPWVDAAKTMINTIIDGTAGDPYGRAETVNANGSSTTDRAASGKSATSGLKGAYQAFLTWYQGDFATNLGNAAEKLGNTVVDFMSDPKKTIQIAFGELSNWFATKFLAALRQTFNQVAKVIEQKLGLEEGTLKTNVKDAWDKFYKFLKDDFPEVKSTFESVYKWIHEFIENPTKTISSLWNLFSTWFKNTFGTDAYNTLEKVGTGIVNFIQNPGETVKSLWEGIHTFLVDTFGPEVTEKIESLGGDIKTFLDDPVGSVKSAWESLYGYLMNTVLPNIVNNLDNVRTAIQGWLDAIGQLTGLQIELPTVKMQYEMVPTNEGGREMVATGVSVTGGGASVRSASPLGVLKTTASGVSALGNAISSVSNWWSNNVSKPIATAVNNKIQSVSSSNLSTVSNSQLSRYSSSSANPNLAVAAQNQLKKNTGSASSGSSILSTVKKFLTGHAEGAYDIPSGEIYLARERGSELVGRIGSHNSVVNNDQIVDGIASGVRSANQEEVRLLRQQNDLLQQMLAKKFSVEVTPSAQWGRNNEKSARLYAQQTGVIR